MKLLLGLAAFVAMSSVPAYAQRATSGSGGAAGGSLGGNAGRLPTYSPHDFQAIYLTGGDDSFTPSTFQSYDQALAEGRAALALKPKTVVEIAQESRNSSRPKAKITISQDAVGRAIIETH